MGSILIIEDNQDVSRMLSEFLLESGYQPESAFSGTDGLRKLKEHCYDLVLLDLMLPYKSGDQVLRELREFSDIPVIVISAKDLVGTKIDLLKLGPTNYITKPFDMGEVEARSCRFKTAKFFQSQRTDASIQRSDTVERCKKCTAGRPGCETYRKGICNPSTADGVSEEGLHKSKFIRDCMGR